MAFSGSTFTILTDWLRDLWRNDQILRNRLEAEFDGIATGLTAVANFGSGVFTGTLPVANGGTGDTGTAWTAYTPTVTAITGAITTAATSGAFKAIGKTVFFRAAITITTNGTGATGIKVTLPVNPLTAMAVSGVNSSTGKQLSVQIGYSATEAGVFYYDATYPAVSGNTFYISGVYEAA